MRGVLEVLSGDREVQAAQCDLLLRTKACAVSGIVPPQVLPRGRGHRVLCTWVTAVRCAEMFDRYRILTEVPVRMLVTRDTALVMLDPAGDHTAVVVRAPSVVTALAGYFEALWDKALSLDAHGDQLSQTSRAILNLLMGGSTDATIARTLQISTRSVRRHVAMLQRRAGVASRFALGAAAARHGWLNTPVTSR